MGAPPVLSAHVEVIALAGKYSMVGGDFKPVKTALYGKQN